MIKKLRDYDFTLIITPILLAAFGIVMIYSASMVSAVVEGLDSTFFLYKQLQWFVLGLIGFILCCIIPYKSYQKFIKVIVLISVILLIAVLLFGETAHQATRSLNLFNVLNIQPSEFIKLVVILYLASVYSKKQLYINNFSKGVLPPLILTSVILSLVIFQPDIGTSAIIFSITAIIILSSGVRYRHMFVLVGIGAILLYLALPHMVTDVRIARFTGAYKPFETPETGGYHLIQSYLAIGAGGLTGEGLGQSIQKLGYLWGAHTDFIMSVIAEELGFIGVIIVIGMLAIIVIRGIFISRKCEDSFGALVAIGISSMIGIQALINLGTISGVLPLTGVTLPFISYGGSSLLALMMAMGILNNIAMSVKKKEISPVRIKKQDLSAGRDFKNLRGKSHV